MAARCPFSAAKTDLELRPVKWLLEHNTVVICGGGGGVPTMYVPGEERKLTGVEAVIDKDLVSELLARELDADLFIITDVDGVYRDWGKPTQQRLAEISAAELKRYAFAAGSMGPKEAAAIQFVEHTGNRAAIGAWADIAQTWRAKPARMWLPDNQPRYRCPAIPPGSTMKFKESK